MAAIEPYQFEPEWDSGEEHHESDPEDDEEGEENILNMENADRARLSNTAWCSCERCAIMRSVMECVCCKELGFLSKIIGDLSCITQHESFEAVCLNREVLWTALVSLHDRESSGLPDRQHVTNRSLRYAAYRQFTWWAHGYLGKNIRRVIPSCAVNKIRATFPAPDGIYAGYTPGDDDDDSLFDSELEQAWRDFLNI